MSDGSHDNPYACLKPARQREAADEVEFLDRFLAQLERADTLELVVENLRYNIDHDPDLKREIRKQLRLRRGAQLKIRDGAL
jgi:hypothetical protein